MDKKLEKKLMDEFPFMEFKSLYTGEKTGVPVSCSCSDGWYKLIHDLCKEIEELYKKNNRDSDEIIVQQVKEKYGGLRFYCTNYIDGVKDIVSKYEDLSCETCEICGREGHSVCLHGWYMTLCDSCEKKDKI